MTSPIQLTQNDMRPKVAEAGGIAVKSVRGTLRFLVIQAKGNADHWVFPKGHIESGEAGADAAVREIREEAGVETEVLCRVGSLEFQKEEKTIQVEFFLAKYSRSVDGGEQREKRWCTYDEALSLLSFEETKDMLRASLPLVKKYYRYAKLN